MADRERDDALVGNAGDEQQVRRAGTHEELAARQADSDLVWLLQQPQFQRWQRRFFAFGGLYESPYRESERETCLAIGRADVVRWHLAHVSRVSPESMAQLRILPSALLQQVTTAPSAPASTRRRRRRKSSPTTEPTHG